LVSSEEFEELVRLRVLGPTEEEAEGRRSSTVGVRSSSEETAAAAWRRGAGVTMGRGVSGEEDPKGPTTVGVMELMEEREELETVDPARSLLA